MLKEHRVKQELDRAMLGIPLKDDNLVFSQLDGKHTHASLMLIQGVHLKIVQERLGHATIAITLDTYSHLPPGLQEAVSAGFYKMVLPKR